MKPIPATWECDPKHCEYLGIDADGYEYWRVQYEVVRHRDGYTRWLCTIAAWPAYRCLTGIAISA